MQRPLHTLSSLNDVNPLLQTYLAVLPRLDRYQTTDCSTFKCHIPHNVTNIDLHGQNLNVSNEQTCAGHCVVNLEV